MDGIALTNLGGVGALPGLSLQFVMESLATVFLASLRVGAFLIASPFLAVRRCRFNLELLWLFYLV